MSRIGKTPVDIPAGVTVSVTDRVVDVKGPKGNLTVDLPKQIEVEVKDNQLFINRKDDEKESKALHGLIRSLINNNVLGVTEGYKKTLKLVGTGYRVAAKGEALSITVGYSHPVEVVPQEGVKLSIEGNNIIHVEGIDKQLVGQVAANIRSIRKPEPYKGKGIRYHDEVVRRKAGKAAVT
ncbi:MAG: 50S ribosomal protein L6 [Candidatus Woesebacteria bacterium]|jgi:large subunit ribosomal protein L6